MAEDTRSESRGEDRSDFQSESGGDTGISTASSTGDTKFDREELGSRFKNYGTKGLKPFEELLERHGDELLPYFDSLVRGLREGGRSLSEDRIAESSNKKTDRSKGDAPKQVSHWMDETAGWLEQIRELLEGRDYKRVIEFVENEGARRPSLMFSSSYVLGLFLGRLGRYAERSRSSGSSTDSASDTDAPMVGGRDFASTDDIPPISERH